VITLKDLNLNILLIEPSSFKVVVVSLDDFYIGLNTPEAQDFKREYYTELHEPHLDMWRCRKELQQRIIISTTLMRSTGASPSR